MVDDDARPFTAATHGPAPSGDELEWASDSMCRRSEGQLEVLFGEHDFQGRLSFSWPRRVGQHPNVGDASYDPLFAYGFGLRYSD